MEQTYRIHYVTPQSRGFVAIQTFSPALAMVEFYTRSISKRFLMPPVTAFDEIHIVGITDMDGSLVENNGLW